MIINLRPLIKHRDFRFLFLSQSVSFLGSMVTYVALPWQVYELTHSTFLVGLLGAVELLPILAFAMIGGAIADSVERKSLLVSAEFIMSLGTLGLMVNSMLDSPSVTFIFLMAGFMQAVNGFHRPAMDSMTQNLVGPEDYAAVGAIGTFRSSVGCIVGPALGGTLISLWGVRSAFLVDFISFMLAVVLLLRLKPIPSSRGPGSERVKILEGVRYAFSRPELLGTYIVDIIAMTFAFPIALFPALGDQWGGAKSAGYLFSSMAVGGLIVTLFSGWTEKVEHHGRCVVLAAATWGLAIVALGFATNLPLAIFCLVLAGAADTTSGIFRQVIWNETIPNSLRGRLSGIEMISYMSGPLLGNTRAGWVASVTSLKFSIVTGGMLCFFGVVVCSFYLPLFWRYRSTRQVLCQE